MTIISPMSETEYELYRLQSIPDYANDKIKSGLWSEAEAFQKAQNDFHQTLPDGLETADNFLFTIKNDQQQAVGILWYAILSRADTKALYIYDISIKAEFQRQGHASEAFKAMQTTVKNKQLSGIELQVFGFNKNAYELYSKLGFYPISIKMFKPCE